MTRICLFLLLALASLTTVATAREAKLGAADGDCPQARTGSAAESTSPALPAAAPPARETETKPAVHSDARAGGHLQAPSWHSFLPGMFR